ncbi:predicted protein [Naegleria gruberi]|uniref:Predicted protein n=1 Tax=Naegleria gruberi TaxID=5762 RepID=D2VY30_NAEGR|nr:uncharacterized protein NAEGRDRAFT_73952 [Naegleria gruberi]EFC38293.1 predicted protein [Naegleria gruberi]|eukprot:XP_002671037.1 predicted protein [Naegleria gruberi strain NEG-M]
MSEIVQTLIQAEKSYIDQLNTLIQKYLLPLADEESSPLVHSVCHQSEEHHQEENYLHNISSSLNIITKLHHFTLTRLEDFSNKNNYAGFGSLFSTVSSQLLAPYKQYYSSVPKILSYLEREKQTNDAYKKWLTENDESKLVDLLVKSPQDHLNFYVTQLNNYGSSSDDEKQNITTSLDYLTKTIESIAQAQHAKHQPIRRLSEKH